MAGGFPHQQALGLGDCRPVPAHHRIVRAGKCVFQIVADAVRLVRRQAGVEALGVKIVVQDMVTAGD